MVFAKQLKEKQRKSLKCVLKELIKIIICLEKLVNIITFLLISL